MMNNHRAIHRMLFVEELEPRTAPATFLTETVDSTGDVGMFTDIAVDGTDTPHVSYYENDAINGYGSLRYATWNGAAWVPTTVVDGPGLSVDAGQYTSIAVDSSNNPHITFTQETMAGAQTVQYYWWTGAGWNNRTVASGSTYNSLALNSANEARHSYYINGTLKLMEMNGFTPTRQVVDSTADVGQYNSIAVDSLGGVWISCYDATNGNLKVARPDSTPPPQQPPTISSLTDSPDPVVPPNLLTLTGNGVSDSDGTVTLVEFYRDVNGNGTLEPGTDSLLGTDNNGVDGCCWTGSASGFPVGTNRYFARAQDNDLLWSAAAATTGVVQDAWAGTWVEIGTGSAVSGGISNNAGDSTNVSVIRGTDGNPIVFWSDKSDPGGTWDVTDSGTYAVAMEPGEVSDTSTPANFVGSWAIGTFDADFGFRVITCAATTSGFYVLLSRNVDLSLLNLYDGQDAAVDAADITLVGSTVGAVKGSVTWDAAARTLHFVKTGAPLAADNYTVTLFSRADGVVDIGAELLDGNGDGTPGGDYMTSFLVGPYVARVLSLPDFARGPDQPVNAPGNGTGLPIRIDDGTGVQRIDLVLRYDSSLLNVTGASLAAGVPGDWSIIADTSVAGTVTITANGTTALSAGAQDCILLTANVPLSAPYGAAHVLDLQSVQLNLGAIAARDDDAVHKVAYLGDTTGNHTYSGLDASYIGRTAVGLDTGFDAMPLVDPVIIGDATGNGMLDVGVDALLGSDVNGADGWSWAGPTAGFPLGTNTFFARAQDDDLAWGLPVSTPCFIDMANIQLANGQVILYDTDDGLPMDVSADDVIVRTRADGCVTSVLITGNPTGLGMIVNPTADVPLFITDYRNANRVGPLEDISFVAATGTLHKVYIRGDLSGFNIGALLATQGFAPGADLDSDGLTNDATAIYSGGPTGSAVIFGNVGGDIVAAGTDAWGRAIAYAGLYGGQLGGEIYGNGNLGQVVLLGGATAEAFGPPATCCACTAPTRFRTPQWTWPATPLPFSS